MKSRELWEKAILNHVKSKMFVFVAIIWEKPWFLRIFRHFNFERMFDESRAKLSRKQSSSHKHSLHKTAFRQLVTTKSKLNFTKNIFIIVFVCFYRDWSSENHRSGRNKKYWTIDEVFITLNVFCFFLDQVILEFHLNEIFYLLNFVSRCVFIGF